MSEKKVTRRLASGQEVEVMGKEWHERTGEVMQFYRTGVVKIRPEGWFYPAGAPDNLDKLQKFEFKSDDVIVVTFPKSGTTWMQELVWTMLKNPDLDNLEGNVDLLVRSPDLHMDMFLEGTMVEFVKDLHAKKTGQEWEDGDDGDGDDDGGDDGGFGAGLKMCHKTPSPRVLKTHFPFSLLPSNLLDSTKIVYVARNPKDVMVSLYHFMVAVKIFSYTGTFEECVRLFLKDEMIFCPYWPHLREAWHRRDHPNLHWVFYEDMQADIIKELHRLDKFLDTRLSSEQLANVATHNNLGALRSRGEPVKNEDFNKTKDEGAGVFFRKGIVGDWRNHFSPELSEEVDEWISSQGGDLLDVLGWDTQGSMVGTSKD